MMLFTLDHSTSTTSSVKLPAAPRSLFGRSRSGLKKHKWLEEKGGFLQRKRAKNVGKNGVWWCCLWCCVWFLVLSSTLPMIYRLHDEFASLRSAKKPLRIFSPQPFPTPTRCFSHQTHGCPDLWRGNPKVCWSLSKQQNNNDSKTNKLPKKRKRSSLLEQISTKKKIFLSFQRPFIQKMRCFSMGQTRAVEAVAWFPPVQRW